MINTMGSLKSSQSKSFLTKPNLKFKLANIIPKLRTLAININMIITAQNKNLAK